MEIWCNYTTHALNTVSLLVIQKTYQPISNTLVSHSPWHEWDVIVDVQPNKPIRSVKRKSHGQEITRFQVQPIKLSRH